MPPPSHYEVRLEADLERIRTSVEAVAKEIEQALRNALHGLQHMDRTLAYRTILGDLAINRAVHQIDDLCHFFVARHLPSAGHLRFISSVLRMTIELERIGDYAVTICRETVQLERPLAGPLRRELERLAKGTQQMLHQTLTAFKERNAELAKGTISYSYQMDRGFTAVFEELVVEGKDQRRSIRDLYRTLVIFQKLERVSDQAVNICHDTIFAVTGEPKEPKRYRILFLDQANDYRSQMAVGFARKAFPTSGEYRSAGRKPAEALDQSFVNFMDEQGIDLHGKKPRAFDWVPEEWADFRVIVSLEGPISDYLSEVPFRTVALEWEIPGPPPKGASPEEAKARYEESMKLVAVEVQKLMEMLRGDEAN